MGIVNRDLAKARALAERFDIRAVFGTLDEACWTPRGRDLVDIITPPRNASQLCCAVRRGWHPGDLPEALRRATTPMQWRSPSWPKRPACRWSIHENFRWQPWYREAKRLIDAGALGTLHSVAFRLRPGDGQGPRAYLDRQPYFQQMPQFLVKETAIHWIDTFRYLVGEVKTVYARAAAHEPGDRRRRRRHIVFEFDDRRHRPVRRQPPERPRGENPRRTMGEAWIEGSGGVLRLDGEARLWWKPHHGAEAEHVYERGPEDTFGGGACEWLQRHVVAHFRSATPLENTAREYLTNLRVQSAVYHSASTHCRVELERFDPLLPQLASAR